MISSVNIFFIITINCGIVICFVSECIRNAVPDPRWFGLQRAKLTGRVKFITGLNWVIAWLRKYCTFSDTSVVRLESSLGQNTPSWDLFSKKNLVPLSNFLSSSNMFFMRLFLANTWTKIGGHLDRLRGNKDFSLLSSFVWRKSLTFLYLHALVWAC